MLLWKKYKTFENTWLKGNSNYTIFYFNPSIVKLFSESIKLGMEVYLDN